MKILALDTSGTDCAVCIYDALSKTVLAEVTEDIGKGHAERLIALVDAAFSMVGLQLSDIGKIVVTIGPGSFTGIRVGVAAARGTPRTRGRPPSRSQLPVGRSAARSPPAEVRREGPRRRQG